MANLRSRGQLLQERNQSVRELVPVLDLPFVEKWKLKHNRPELVAEYAHRVQELSTLSITVQQHFLVRNGLRNLDRKDEALGCSSLPVFNRSSGGTCVESRIHFDRMKVLCVERQVVGRPHSLRIERSVPSRGCEGRRSEEDGRMVHSGEYSEGSAD